MNLVKDKTSGIYRAEIRTPFGRRRITTKQTSLEAAKASVEAAGLKQIEDAARTGQLMSGTISRVLAGKSLKLTVMMGKWLDWLNSCGKSQRTIANYRVYLEPFAVKFDDTSPSLIGVDQVNAWINNPELNEHRSTRNMRLTILRSFFNFCIANHWCVGNPTAIVRVRSDILTHAQKERHARVPFTNDEVDKLLAACPSGEFWHTAIALGRYTGLRLNDIARLEWDCLSDPGFVTCHTDKHDARVRVPIDSTALELALSSLMPPSPKSKRDRFMFQDQAEIASSTSRRALLSVQFARLCAQIGIEGKSFHCLRHAYATEQRRSGKELWYIAENLGHANLKTTAGYVH